MIGPRIVLLLLGTTIAYCHILPNGDPCKEETHPLPDKPAIIIARHGLQDLASVQPTVLTSARVPPFIQQGTNLFYKPQFMMPGHFIPTAISNVINKKEENPPKPEILFPEPLYISQVPEIIIPNAIENSETKPVTIPQAPEIPLFTNEVFEVQSAPRPIIVEEPAETSRSMDLPQPPELPLSFSDVHTPVVEEVVPPYTTGSPSFPMTIKSAPIVLGVIPESPVLPPFTMPALPVLSRIPSEPGTNLIEIPEPPMLHPIVNPIILDIEGESLSDFKPVKIPEAPTLPPFTKFELPAHVTVPAAPEFPAFVDINPVVDCKPFELPEPPVIPSFTMREQSVKAVIPAAPELPPFVGIEPVSEFKAIKIPEPVILPPLPMPELPEHAVVPVTPEIQLNPEIKPINIPEPPVLPFFIKPQLPSPVFTPLNSEGPASIALLQSIPEAPALAPMVSVPCFPESYQIAPVSEWQPIPPPPELTPVQISTIPAPLDDIVKQEHVVIPEAPELLPISNSLIPEVIEYKPIHIPQAPELSFFTMPELPTIIIDKTEKPYQEIPTPSEEIPAPPVLPPFVIQSIPIFAETPEQASDFKPMDIPSAPELPSLTMPTIPVPLVIEENYKELCDKDTSEKVAPTVIIPEVPLVASSYSQLTQPIFWAQNIIIERVLPHIFVSEKDHMKTLEVGTSDPVNTIPYFISSSH